MNRQTSKRISNINRIRRVLHEANQKGVNINYKKLIAIVCLDSNVSERKAKEYVNLLVNSGEAVLEYGEIYLNDTTERGHTQNGE